MIQKIYVRPKTDLKTNAPSEERIENHLTSEDELEEISYTIAYVGPYTYTGDVNVDNNMHMVKKERIISYNFHIGNGNSFGNGLRCVFGRNHNIKRVASGALETSMKYSGIPFVVGNKNTFRQKGTIIFQNDIWVGDNVTVMGGCIVRNGAVLAQNSHVVKDVPAYAIMGGNPARVIGWRFPKAIIEKLQTIQWWYWDHDKILRNYEYFTEDVEGFCDRFYDEAKQQFDLLCQRRNVRDDAYMVYVDYYENYSSYPAIIEEFLDAFLCDESKRLILFIQNDVEGGG